MPGDALDRYPGELSGGQRQRVGLMRALMLDPEVLLLDEPLGAIDPLVRAELQDGPAAVFRQLRKSVVLVTHDLAEAAFFADRLVLMREGRIVQQGRARELVSAPADPSSPASSRPSGASIPGRWRSGDESAAGRALARAGCWPPRRPRSADGDRPCGWPARRSPSR